MGFKGGYNILLRSRPDSAVESLPEPDALCLSSSSRRFLFDEICVEEGQQVNGGDVIAKDPNKLRPTFISTTRWYCRT